ncbi:hypothetical protein Leryth_002530 [Lithospermum erythrorhizon]|nr:hypothetical protein Leryth_002530 [Lithospermum erythrorhizon]
MIRGKRANKLRSMDLKDIIRENALHFLPAKSLLKFQSVCREWRLQISTPFFEHNQSLSARAIQGLFCQRPGAPPMLIPFDPSCCGVPDPSLGFLPEAVDIRSSSNGLLLCQACSGDRDYYVCNPVTQKFKKLPKPSADHGNDAAIVLIFEPSLLNFEAEYKIVCAFQSADFNDASEFDIYSSRDGSWKTSGEICFATSPSTSIAKQGIYANGVVYFTAGSGFLSYDVAKDRSQLLKNYYGVCGTLGIVNGKLCSALLRGSTLTLSLLVNIHSNTMQMNSHSRMWDNQGGIALGAVLGSDVQSQSVLFVGGDLVVIQAGERLISYDLNTKVSRELSKPPKDYLTRVVPYVNSLVSL